VVVPASTLLSCFPENVRGKLYSPENVRGNGIDPTTDATR